MISRGKRVQYVHDGIWAAACHPRCLPGTDCSLSRPMPGWSKDRAVSKQTEDKKIFLRALRKHVWKLLSSRMLFRMLEVYVGLKKVREQQQNIPWHLSLVMAALNQRLIFFQQKYSCELWLYTWLFLVVKAGQPPSTAAVHLPVQLRGKLTGGAVTDWTRDLRFMSLRLLLQSWELQFFVYLSDFLKRSNRERRIFNPMNFLLYIEGKGGS